MIISYKSRVTTAPSPITYQFNGCDPFPPNWPARPEDEELLRKEMTTKALMLGEIPNLPGEWQIAAPPGPGLVILVLKRGEKQTHGKPDPREIAG
jgi:hypothetical protein